MRKQYKKINKKDSCTKTKSIDDDFAIEYYMQALNKEKEYYFYNFFFKFSIFVFFFVLFFCCHRKHRYMTMCQILILIYS